MVLLFGFTYSILLYHPALNTQVIDNLGVREEIKSVRFFDDKAYIVTFRRVRSPLIIFVCPHLLSLTKLLACDLLCQTDPLYTIDFRDPRNPVVADELKITGYSSYLHPVNSSRLLAIGKEANETTGRVTGVSLMLFFRIFAPASLISIFCPPDCQSVPDYSV